jgi:hypothetical protein
VEDKYIEHIWLMVVAWTQRCRKASRAFQVYLIWTTHLRRLEGVCRMNNE